MKCKNKEINVKGMVYNDISRSLSVCNFRVICTNDEKGFYDVIIDDKSDFVKVEIVEI